VPISDSFLPRVRKAIRQFLVIPEREPADLIVLASVLANLYPKKEVNVWLAIVGAPGSGKTELLDLLHGSKQIWVLPQRITSAYFLSAMREKASALKRLERGKYRVLCLPDMISLTSLSRQYRDEVYAQLIGIHDGHLKHETGWQGKTLIYGPKDPGDRIGWVGSVTDEFYSFQTHYLPMGSRFLLYHMDGMKYREWHDTDHLMSVGKKSTGKTSQRVKAREEVQRFIETVQSYLGEFDDVEFAERHELRIAAAVTLTMRLLNSLRSSDAGVRPNLRIREICRMIAFMSGRMSVDSDEADIGVAIALSQLNPWERRLLEFAMHPNQLQTSWSAQKACVAIGATQRLIAPFLQNWQDVGVLRRDSQGNKRKSSVGREAFRYKLTKETLKLVRSIDPTRAMYIPDADLTGRPEPEPEPEPEMIYSDGEPDDLSEIEPEFFDQFHN
jgi:hypothetical protein